MRYTADFETTTTEQDCRVWAWGVYQIENGMFYHGSHLNKFLELMENTCDHETSYFYFHNLKFDGKFILHCLLSSGYTYVKERKELDAVEARVEKKYNTVDDCPEWARDTVKRLSASGILAGDGSGFALTEDMLRLLVMIDRAGVFK